MTPDEQRIAIAEWVGWKRDTTRKNVWLPKERPGFLVTDIAFFPDYLNDLNAMAEAEQLVPHEKQPYLLRSLKRDVMNYPEGVSDWDIYTATATQRAEALLRTLGKYTE